MLNVLLFEKKSVFFDFEKYPVNGFHISQEDMFNKKIKGIFRKIFIHVPFLTVFALGDWIKDKNNYDCCIIPDIYFNKNILRIIKKKNNIKRFNLYYRNKITKRDIPDIKYASRFNMFIYTYNKSDAAKYELLYNPQVWNSHIADLSVAENIQNDVYFVGAIKDRYSILMSIKHLFDLNNINSLLHIISNNGEPFTMKKDVDYVDVIRNIKQSRVLLDVVANSNYGLTLRPLEAIFLKKKLITNYKEIIYEDFYPYYKDDIFVIGIDDTKNLRNFVYSDFVSNSNYILKYDNENWLKNFFDVKHI